MAVNRPYNIPQSREAMGVYRDKKGELINIFASRPMYRWQAQIEALTGPDSPLAAAEDGTVDNATDIADNTADIDANNTSIAMLNADIAALQLNLIALANQVAIIIADLNAHVLATVAHGSIGDVVGFGDVAGLGQVGVVEQATDPTDSTAVTVAGIVDDYNTLLAELRTAGIL